MQYAQEILDATHASIVAHKGSQSWLLFTGEKSAASNALTAIGSAFNLTHSNARTEGWVFQLYYHPEVKGEPSHNAFQRVTDALRAVKMNFPKHPEVK